MCVCSCGHLDSSLVSVFAGGMCLLAMGNFNSSGLSARSVFCEHMCMCACMYDYDDDDDDDDY